MDFKKMMRKSKFNKCSERTLHLIKKEISRLGMRKANYMLFKRVLAR
jgi:hypothetical protein